MNPMIRTIANWIARRRAKHPVFMETTDLAYVASRLSRFDKNHMTKTSLEFVSRMRTCPDCWELTANQASFIAKNSLNDGIDFRFPREALIQNGTMLLFNLVETTIQLQNQGQQILSPGFMVWAITLRAELLPEMRPLVKEMWSFLESYYGREIPTFGVA